MDAGTLVAGWLALSVLPIFFGRFDVATFIFALPLLVIFAVGALFVGAFLIGIPIFIVYIALSALLGG